MLFIHGNDHRRSGPAYGVVRFDRVRFFIDLRDIMNVPVPFTLMSLQKLVAFTLPCVLKGTLARYIWTLPSAPVIKQVLSDDMELMSSYQPGA